MSDEDDKNNLSKTQQVTINELHLSHLDLQGKVDDLSNSHVELKGEVSEVKDTSEKTLEVSEKVYDALQDDAFEGRIGLITQTKINEKKIKKLEDKEDVKFSTRQKILIVAVPTIIASILSAIGFLFKYILK